MLCKLQVVGSIPSSSTRLLISAAGLHVCLSASLLERLIGEFLSVMAVLEVQSADRSYKHFIIAKSFL